MEAVLRIVDVLKSFQKTVRPRTEFFNFNRLSRPANFNAAVSRISYNTKYFHGNYLVIILILAVYTIWNNLWVLTALVPLVGGFSLVNKLGVDPLRFGKYPAIQKSLSTGPLIIGIPLLLWASPLGISPWLVGASSLIILGHASVMKPRR